MRGVAEGAPPGGVPGALCELLVRLRGCAGGGDPPKVTPQLGEGRAAL